MSARPELRVVRPTPSLDDRAAADLAFIRGTMERASQFSALPGWGAIAMGVVGLVAAGVAQTFVIGSQAWLTTWIVAAAAGVLVGAVALIHKASGTLTPLSRGVGRRFVLCQAPSLLVGALLSVGMVLSGQAALLPAVWLLSYGSGVTAAGALSPPVVPITGTAILLLGAVAIFAPPTWGGALMALGFGVAHLVAGTIVVRRHGG